MGDAVDWVVAVDGSSTLYQGFASLAWAPSSRFRLGASVGLYYQETSSAILFAGGVANPATGESRAALSDSALLATATWGLRAGLGIQWELHDALVLGASVDSPSLALTRTQSIAEVFQSHGVGMRSTFATSEAEERLAGGDLVLPLRARLGLAVRGDWGWVSIDGDVQHALRTEYVDRELVWNLRAGALFRAHGLVRVGVGAFTDRSPDPPVDGFASGPTDFYGGTVGLQLGNERFLDAHLEDDRHMLFRTTVALRYAYGRGEIGNLVVGSGAELAIVESRAVDARAHEVGVHLGSTVLF